MKGRLFPWPRERVRIENGNRGLLALPTVALFPSKASRKASIMPPEALAGALRQQPFAPFRIHLDDGTTYEIRHPELVIVGRRGAAVVGITATDEAPLMVDRFETVAIFHITRLEPIDAATVQGNGQ